jgi:hypothetical protein
LPNETSSADKGGWDLVEVEVERVIAGSPDPFHRDTILNAHDVLMVCRNACPVPLRVSKGYWSTVSLSWSNFEIEIFEDRVEVYHFFDKKTDIWYEDHRPGEAFTPRFLSELAALNISLMS